MPKYKIRVNSKQAVESIRSGMSDLALMEEYALSARGLQSLFRKLTAAGEIEQSELNARHLACQQSHIVDLIISQPKYAKKAVIDADQAVRDIRAGMSDIELMQKYDVSAQGLESLFSKLIAASQISPRELDERKRRFRWSEIGFEKNSAGNGEPLDEPVRNQLSVVTKVLVERSPCVRSCFSGSMHRDGPHVPCCGNRQMGS